MSTSPRASRVAARWIQAAGSLATAPENASYEAGRKAAYYGRKFDESRKADLSYVKGYIEGFEEMKEEAEAEEMGHKVPAYSWGVYRKLLREFNLQRRLARVESESIYPNKIGRQVR